jgi:hypothetical protein
MTFSSPSAFHFPSLRSRITVPGSRLFVILFFHGTEQATKKTIDYHLFTRFFSSQQYGKSFFLPPFKRKKLRLCWHQESDLPQRRQGVLSESITILILEEILQLAERSGPATQCQDGYYVPYFLR